MAWCGPCSRWFSTYNALEDHYLNSAIHDYCGECRMHFDDEDEHLDHNVEFHHACRSCNKLFPRGGARGLHEHNRQSHADRYCVPCQRLFQNANNFRNHMNSSLHREKDVQCPMRGCGEKFVSASAMALHLDQGNCVSGMNRAKVNELVVRYDRNNIITNPSRLIGGPGSTSYAPAVTMYKANQRSWNGSAYECYLCNREFSRLEDLNRHLNSPRHQEKIYRCPRSDCRKEFTTLSGIMQHVESQSCDAYRFRAVQDVWKGLNSNLRSIAYY